MGQDKRQPDRFRAGGQHDPVGKTAADPQPGGDRHGGEHDELGDQDPRNLAFREAHHAQGCQIAAAFGKRDARAVVNNAERDDHREREIDGLDQRDRLCGRFSETLLQCRGDAEVRDARHFLDFAEKGTPPARVHRKMRPAHRVAIGVTVGAQIDVVLVAGQRTVRRVGKVRLVAGHALHLAAGGQGKRGWRLVGARTRNRHAHRMGTVARRGHISRAVAVQAHLVDIVGGALCLASPLVFSFLLRTGVNF